MLPKREVRQACEALQDMGQTGIFSTLGADQAVILCELGRFEEVEPVIELSRRAAAAEDVISQIRWRVAQARVLADRRRMEEAMDLARQAAALTEPPDLINFEAESHVPLAVVLDQAGGRNEAVEALKRALSLFEQKGNEVSAARTRQMLADMMSSAGG